MSTIVKLQLGEVKSKLLNPNDAVGNSKAKALLRVACRANPDGYRFSKRYRNGSWDGFVYLSDGVSFPTGLLSTVVDMFHKHGATVSVDYGPYTGILNNSPAIDPDCLEGLTLRDYQVSAVISMLNSCRGVAKMATNAGKTEVMSVVLKYLDLPSITIVPNKKLLHQTAETLSLRLNCAVGKIGDGLYTLEKHTVCIINSLINKLSDPRFLEHMANNCIVNIDECHTTSESERMLEAIGSIPGVYRFGYSATPLKKHRLADMRLIGMSGKVLTEVTNKQLIDAGYSATPTVRLVTVAQDNTFDWKLDYHKAYNDLVVNNATRNDLIRRICKRHSGDTILIPVSRIAHGELLREIINGATFVSGESSSAERNDFEQAIATKPGVYIACKIYDMGANMPAVNVLIFAAGGKAEHTQIQRMGRGLRAKPGNDNTVIMYDFVDDTNRYLLEHSEARINAYITEEFHVEEATI